MSGQDFSGIHSVLKIFQSGPKWTNVHTDMHFVLWYLMTNPLLIVNTSNNWWKMLDIYAIMWIRNLAQVLLLENVRMAQLSILRCDGFEKIALVRNIFKTKSHFFLHFISNSFHFCFSLVSPFQSALLLSSWLPSSLSYRHVSPPLTLSSAAPSLLSPMIQPSLPLFSLSMLTFFLTRSIAPSCTLFLINSPFNFPSRLPLFSFLLSPLFLSLCPLLLLLLLTSAP